MMNKILLFCTFIFLTAIYIYSLGKLTVIETNLDQEAFSVSTKNPKNFRINNLSYGELLKGEKLTGSFVATDKFLGQVSIRFYNFQRINPDSLIFRIKEAGQNNWYYENTYTSGQFQPHQLFPFGFPVISDSEGKKYIFELESLDGLPEHSIGLSPIKPLGAVLYQYPRSYLFSSLDIFTNFIVEEKIQRINLSFQSAVEIGTYISFMIISLILINLGLNQFKKFNLKLFRKNKYHFIIILGVLLLCLSAITNSLKKTHLSLDITIGAYFVLLIGLICILFELKFKNKNS